MEHSPWNHTKMIGTSIVVSVSAGDMELSCLPHLTGMLPPENMLKPPIPLRRPGDVVINRSCLHLAQAARSRTFNDNIAITSSRIDQFMSS
jgi:hypothetical protein